MDLTIGILGKITLKDLQKVELALTALSLGIIQGKW